MRHEKIFKRENGTQFLISVDISIDVFRSDPRWGVTCFTRDRQKKLWKHLPDTLGDYQIRSLPTHEREKHNYENILRFVTPEEILSVKLELWQKIKPI